MMALVLVSSPTEYQVATHRYWHFEADACRNVTGNGGIPHGGIPHLMSDFPPTTCLVCGNQLESAGPNGPSQTEPWRTWSVAG